MSGGRTAADIQSQWRIWRRCLKRVGLRYCEPYQTRHTFASNALAAGEAPSWVAQMLGHTTPEMLFTVYARYIPNRTRRDGSAFASRMGEAALPEAQKALAVIPK